MFKRFGIPPYGETGLPANHDRLFEIRHGLRDLWMRQPFCNGEEEKIVSLHGSASSLWNLRII